LCLWTFESCCARRCGCSRSIAAIQGLGVDAATLDDVAATGLFDREEVERARSYHRPLYLAAVAGIVLDLALLAVLSFTGVGDDLYAVTDGWPWWARGLAFSVLVVALVAGVDLPIGFWAGYMHEHAWALSTQSIGSWSLDRLKGLAVNLVLTTCAFLGLLVAARAWPVGWPLVVAGAAAFLVLVLSFVAPVVLEPLFNHFRPLADRELAASLRRLSARAGVPVRRILVADASRRTRKLNAYVSGLGRTRRVVLFDTLVSDAGRQEVQLVVAHELGHRRAQHVAKATLLAMVGAAGFVFALWAILHWPALRSTIGITGPGDSRIIPFVLLLGSMLGLVASPFGASLSRRWERQADAFSLELTRDPETFESTHRRLALTNLADLAPPRLVYLAWFSHPTPPERIATARALSRNLSRVVGRSPGATAERLPR
jgi:STE24 endopeptidase